MPDKPTAEDLIREAEADHRVTCDNDPHDPMNSSSCLAYDLAQRLKAAGESERKAVAAAIRKETHEWAKAFRHERHARGQHE